MKQLPLIILLDSVSFYAPVKAERCAAEKMFAFEKQGIITLEIAQATEEELKKIKKRVNQNLWKRIEEKIVCMESIDSNSKRSKYNGIKRTLFPNKKPLGDNDERDVRNIYTAYEHRASMFITYDIQHIRSNANLIEKQYGVKAVTPKEGLKYIEKVRELNNAGQLDDFNTIPDEIKSLMRGL